MVKKFSEMICLCLLLINCSLLAPEHDFENKKVHSYLPGSFTKDSLAVLAILKANQIPSEKFSYIVKIGMDQRVHSLNLSRMGIDTIPNEIGDLGALEHLDLSNNRLRSLPDSITKINIFYSYKLCQGPCGGSDCCRTESRNGLLIYNNSLCEVNSCISSWVDKQFKTKAYLQSDSTQLCQN